MYEVTLTLINRANDRFEKLSDKTYKFFLNPHFVRFLISTDDFNEPQTRDERIKQICHAFALKKPTLLINFIECIYQKNPNNNNEIEVLCFQTDGTAETVTLRLGADDDLNVKMSIHELSANSIQRGAETNRVYSTNLKNDLLTELKLSTLLPCGYYGVVDSYARLMPAEVRKVKDLVSQYVLASDEVLKKAKLTPLDMVIPKLINRDTYQDNKQLVLERFELPLAHSYASHQDGWKFNFESALTARLEDVKKETVGPYNLELWLTEFNAREQNAPVLELQKYLKLCSETLNSYNKYTLNSFECFIGYFKEEALRRQQAIITDYEGGLKSYVDKYNYGNDIAITDYVREGMARSLYNAAVQYLHWIWQQPFNQGDISHYFRSLTNAELREAATKEDYRKQKLTSLRDKFQISCLVNDKIEILKLFEVTDGGDIAPFEEIWKSLKTIPLYSSRENTLDFQKLISRLLAKCDRSYVFDAQALKCIKENLELFYIDFYKNSLELGFPVVRTLRHAFATPGAPLFSIEGNSFEFTRPVQVRAIDAMKSVVIQDIKAKFGDPLSYVLEDRDFKSGHQEHKKHIANKFAEHQTEICAYAKYLPYYDQVNSLKNKVLTMLESIEGLKATINTTLDDLLSKTLQNKFIDDAGLLDENDRRYMIDFFDRMAMDCKTRLQVCQEQVVVKAMMDKLDAYLTIEADFQRGCGGSTSYDDIVSMLNCIESMREPQLQLLALSSQNLADLAADVRDKISLLTMPSAFNNAVTQAHELANIEQPAVTELKIHDLSGAAALYDDRILKINGLSHSLQANMRQFGLAGCQLPAELSSYFQTCLDDVQNTQHNVESLQVGFNNKIVCHLLVGSLLQKAKGGEALTELDASLLQLTTQPDCNNWIRDEEKAKRLLIEMRRVCNESVVDHAFTNCLHDLDIDHTSFTDVTNSIMLLMPNNRYANNSVLHLVEEKHLAPYRHGVTGELYTPVGQRNLDTAPGLQIVIHVPEPASVPSKTSWIKANWKPILLGIVVAAVISAAVVGAIILSYGSAAIAFSAIMTTLALSQTGTIGFLAGTAAGALLTGGIIGWGINKIYQLFASKAPATRVLPANLIEETVNHEPRRGDDDPRMSPRLRPVLLQSGVTQPIGIVQTEASSMTLTNHITTPPAVGTPSVSAILPKQSAPIPAAAETPPVVAILPGQSAPIPIKPRNSMATISSRLLQENETRMRPISPPKAPIIQPTRSQVPLTSSASYPAALQSLAKNGNNFSAPNAPTLMQKGKKAKVEKVFNVAKSGLSKIKRVVTFQDSGFFHTSKSKANLNSSPSRSSIKYGGSY